MIGDHALNSLTFQHQQVSLMLGHSLRSLYQDLLNAPILDSLQTLAAQLEPRLNLDFKTTCSLSSKNLSLPDERRFGSCHDTTSTYIRGPNSSPKTMLAMTAPTTKQPGNLRE
jgi:hypothetical protein